MTMRRNAMMLATLLLAAACGSNPTGTDPQQVLGQLVEAATGRGQVPEDQLQQAATLTRADIAGVTLPLMRATIPAVGGAATASLAAINGPTETWAAPGGTDFTLDGPVLFATRGIGWDLLTAETAAPKRLLLSGGSGSYQRTLRHLSGDEAIDLVRYDCALRQQGTETIVILERSHRVRRATEDCRAEDGRAFQNIYWVGDGVLWQSRQYISERLGYLVTERLVR